VALHTKACYSLVTVARTALCIALLLMGFVEDARFVAPADVCTATCPDDDEHGRCAPDCNDCACCSHARTIAVPLSSGSLEERLVGVPVVLRIQAPLSPELTGIRHVPKASQG
jgi:hypothetical protein